MFRTMAKTRDYWLWTLVITFGLLVFLLFPGAASEKSRAVLHGLCAQTPSHSFAFGGTVLPFDGRMTGIYAGSIATILSLVATRRLLFYGNPPWKVVGALILGACLMAIDGMNSLLTDLRLWHPYQSLNELRLVTGYLMGMALGVALCWLFGSSVWRMSKPEAGVAGFRNLLLPAGQLIPFAAIMFSGWEVFLLPLTLFLMIAAWLTLSLLMLVVVLLIFRYEDQVASVTQLQIPGVVASGLALGIMLGMAGGRFWLERSLGLPALL